MTRHARILAFFLLTLVVTAGAHLAREPTLAELLDAVVSSLVIFTAPFAVGDALARRKAAGRTWTLAGREAASGLAAAALVQAVIWAFWMSFPHDERYALPLWVTLAHPLLALLAGAFGLPAAGSGRRRRPSASDLRLTLAHAARVGALFAVLGLGLQLVRGDRWRLTAPFTFALPPAVAAALLAAAGALWLAVRRRRAGWLALALALVVGAAAGVRDWRPGGCPDPGRSLAAPATRLLTWNVRHQLGAATARQLRALDADVVVLVEASRVETDRWARLLPGHEICAPGGGLVVLSRGPIGRCDWRRLEGRSRAAVVDVVDAADVAAPANVAGTTAPDSVPILRLVAVDVDGHPLTSRRRAIQAIADLLRDEAQGAVVAGDFNTPRRATGFDPLRRTHYNAWSAAGRGWAGSWPAPLPVLDIDHVWLPASLAPAEVSCARFLPAAGSDHRPLLVEWAGRGPTPRR